MSRKENERRRSQRQRRRLDVRFWNDEFEGRGFTTNVSNKGLLIETDGDARINLLSVVGLTDTCDAG